MILIYLNKHTARSEYVFGCIFKEHFGIVYKTTNDLQEFENYSGSKINYSTQQLDSGFYIYNNGLLEDDSLKRVDVTIGEKQGVKVLFPSPDCDLGFDLFSGAFYLLSRYEEYLPFTEDKFGRFKAEDSLAYKNGFLETPIIDAGIHLLAEKMNLKANFTGFKAILTYDIDTAYKFKGRSFGRNVGSTGKDILKLDFKNIVRRVQTFLKIKKDPWDIYDELKENLQRNQLDSIFFFLVGNNSEHDRNLEYNSPAMEQLINKVSQFTEIGVHPSFASNKRLKRVIAEKQRIEFITGKKIRKSRQHYLKLQFPHTYLNLLEAGITEDYSMGFPDHVGFRAGTCHPFYFYDLKNEGITDLKIFPVSCMEGTFINSKTDLATSLKQILNLIKEVKNVNGTFISIWHNHTISGYGEYKGWENIHGKIIQAILSKSSG